MARKHSTLTFMSFGLGVRGLRQIPMETLDILKSADGITYLKNMRGLLQINPNTHDLAGLYSKPERGSYSSVLCATMFGLS